MALDLISVIEDSVSDATADPDPVDTPAVEASSEPADTPADSPEASPDPSSDPIDPSDDTATPESSSAVPSPAASRDDAQKPVDDPFAKEHGLTPQMSGGRENRIPYSRVKSIVEKAQQKAIAPLTAELTPLKAKVTDYESRLQKVGEFEKIMSDDPQKMLQMLATLPAYKPFFDAVAHYEALSQSQLSQPTTPVTPSPSTAPTNEGMPAPDQKLSDGSMVYSMEGLNKLMAWQAQQVETRVTKQVTDQISERYKPIEQQYQAQEHLQKMIPVINSQIAEARTWPLFTENETEITQALESDRRLSLEGAYRRVVYPKLITNKDTMRADILKEIKAVPTGSTSVSSTASRPSPVTSGPKSLEEIIKEQVQSLK